MPYDLGDTVRLVGLCHNPAGVLTDAATAALTVTKPDGTTDTPNVPAPSPTGTYTVDYVPAQAGRHSYRFLFTGPNAAVADVFDVREASPGYIISLAEAKTQLKITGMTHDDALRRVIEATTRVVERHLDEVVAQRTITETVRATGRGTVVLSRSPVLSLTSMSSLDGEVTWTVADLDVDTVTGVVRAVRGRHLCGLITAVYPAGYRVIPANYLEAAEIIVQHLWETTRGVAGVPRVGGLDDTTTVTGMGYAIPNRALELLGAAPPQVG